jgi:hypothetical protein
VLHTAEVLNAALLTQTTTAFCVLQQQWRARTNFSARLQSEAASVANKKVNNSTLSREGQDILLHHSSVQKERCRNNPLFGVNP